MIKFDLEKLIKLVGVRPGITSREIIREFHIVCENPKSADNALIRVQKKLDAMEDSPIFFQKYGTARHWFTAEYAEENNLQPVIYKEDKDRGSNGESSRYLSDCKLINQYWPRPGLASV